MKSRQTNFLFTSLFVILGLVGIISCNTSSPDTSNGYPQSETFFEVSIPEPLQEGERIYLELVDEVTGVTLNPTRFEMQAKDHFNYSVRVPITTESSIRYRYVKNGSSNIVESMTDGQQVFYRAYLVKGPSTIHDVIPGWNDQPYQGATGEISGYIYDKQSEVPLNEILVFINGMRTFTGSDGFFEFKNVPIGEHHLVALHPDGTYQSFQQGAIISENALTPASFGMELAKIVSVTFEVSVPDDTPLHASIRLLGNTIELGNSYSSLRAGTSIVPSRSPLLEKVDDQKYRIQLDLPVGFDLRYKYSLGDGFINAEHDENGNFLTRQVIIPAKNFTVSNSIDSWSSTGNPPVTFNITTPPSTPTSDNISIQFNPYTWMPAIPMWKNGENQWAYTLFGPFEYLDQSQYRFCRNDQCGLADDMKTPGPNGLGYILSLSPIPPTVIDYEMESWVGMEPFGYEIIQGPLPLKSEAYIKGIQISDRYDFSWLPYMQWGFVEAAVNDSNWVIFSPSWSFKNLNDLPSIQFWPNINPSEYDLSQIIHFANESNQVLALFPIPRFEESFEDYWLNSPKTYNWWNEWFDQYERFVLSYADLASKNNIPALIIGGNHVSPAFPNGKLNDTPSNTPFEFADRWEKLIEKIRERYDGLLIFSLPSSTTPENHLGFINQADLIYYTFDHSLSTSNDPLMDELDKNAEKMLDSEIYQLYAIFQKPILLSLNYPSTNGTSHNCTNYDKECAKIDSELLTANEAMDMKEQADIYQTIIRAAFKRDWIFGIISNGYNPSVSVQDLSSSIRGKPALSVISYYFRAINN